MMIVNWYGSPSSPCIKLKMHLSINTSKSAIDSWLFSSVSIKVWNTKPFQCVTMCHCNCVMCHSPLDLLSSPTCLLVNTADSCENVQVVCTPALLRNWCSLCNAHSFGTLQPTVTGSCVSSLTLHWIGKPGLAEGHDQVKDDNCNACHTNY